MITQFIWLSIYLCVTLTLSILTIMQRHGVVTTMLVASAVCVGSGRARERLWWQGGRSVHCAKASCN